MTNCYTDDVLKIILDIAKSINNCGTMLNERYLHHYLSNRLQEKICSLNLLGDCSAITLHPEWPTYKNKTGIQCRKYKKADDNKFYPDHSGKGGFIDFAIGNYQSPEIGIEVTLKSGWADEEIVYDLMKMMDRALPFSVRISFNFLIRENNLKNSAELERKMEQAVEEAQKRLQKNEKYDSSPKAIIIFTEIGNNNSRRHWHYDRLSNKFLSGLPKITK